MALHFDRGEYKRRQELVQKQMIKEGLDGLLVFRQESMYYLTGYETMGYSQFQGLYFRGDSAVALLTRAPDVQSAKLTSIVEDIRVWVDRENENPAAALREVVDSLGGRGKRIGVEYHAYGLTAQRGKMLDRTFDGFCTLVDASDLVREVSLVKSPAELAYIRRAGKITDDLQSVAHEMTVPGMFLGKIYGEMLRVILSEDGDPPASRFPMGAGENALLSRYHAGGDTIAREDQIQFEPAASFRHYHAGLRFMTFTGSIKERQRRMFEACCEALQACQDVMKPNNLVGDIFDAYVRSFTKAGFGGHFPNSCGYPMGATFPPTWMVWPMVCSGNSQVQKAGMVFFLPISLIDRADGLFMTAGETYVITEQGCEPVTTVSRKLMVN